MHKLARKCMVVIVVVLALCASTSIASPVGLGNGGGSLFSVQIGVGTSKHPLNLDVLGMSGGTALNLESGIGVYDPSCGVALYSAISQYVREKNLGDLRVEYAIGAVPMKANTKPLDTDVLGMAWTVEFKPGELPNMPVRVFLSLVDAKGEKKSINAFFKITPPDTFPFKELGLGSKETREGISIWLVPAGWKSASVGTNGPDMKKLVAELQQFADDTSAAIDGLKRNQDNLDSRLTAVEDSLDLLKSKQPAATSTFVIRFDRPVYIWMTINGQKKRSAICQTEFVFPSPEGTENCLEWCTTLSGSRRMLRFVERAGGTIEVRTF